MNLTIIILVSILSILFVFRGTIFVDKLLNKYADIQNIVNITPQNYGDILTGVDNFTIKFLWTTKHINFNQIDKIKAYSTVDVGLENHFKFLEICTKNKETLSFDANRPSHRDLVTIFIKTHCDKTINLEGDFPPVGADNNGVINCGGNKG